MDNVNVQGKKEYIIDNKINILNNLKVDYYYLIHGKLEICMLEKINLKICKRIFKTTI